MNSRQLTGVPVLMYHEVAPRSDHDALSRVTQRNYILSIEQFSEHLAALEASGARTITLSQLRAWQRESAAIPARSVVMTFDDGYAGNHAHAARLLAERGYSATFFVVTGKIGEPFMMSWSQLRELRDAGMAVESHTVTHPLFSCIDRARTVREIVDSKHEIEDRLDTAVRHMSLPYGDTNCFYEEIAREAGYETGCSSRGGLNEASTSPFHLRRIAMTTAMSSDMLARICLRDPQLLRRLERGANLKRALARLLGKRNYDRLVNRIHGVEGHDSAYTA